MWLLAGFFDRKSVGGRCFLFLIVILFLNKTVHLQGCDILNMGDIWLPDIYSVKRKSKQLNEFAGIIKISEQRRDYKH